MEQSKAAGLGARPGPRRRAHQVGWQTGAAQRDGDWAFKIRARIPTGRPPCSVASWMTYSPRAQGDGRPAASRPASTTNLFGPLRHPPPDRLCPPLFQRIAMGEVLWLRRELQSGIWAAAGDGCSSAGIGCLRRDRGKGKSMALVGRGAAGLRGTIVGAVPAAPQGKGWEPLCPPSEKKVGWPSYQEFQEL